MSNEQEGVDGLPTAAIVSFAGEETHEFEAYGSDETDLTYKDNVEQGDELVRRKDVADLIQDKINQMEEKKNEISTEDLKESEVAQKLFSEYRAVKGQFKELLDEVEHQ